MKERILLVRQTVEAAALSLWAGEMAPQLRTMSVQFLAFMLVVYNCFELQLQGI